MYVSSHNIIYSYSNIKFYRFIKRLHSFEHVISCKKIEHMGYFSFEIAIVAYDTTVG